MKFRHIPLDSGRCLPLLYNQAGNPSCDKPTTAVPVSPRDGGIYISRPGSKASDLIRAPVGADLSYEWLQR